MWNELAEHLDDFESAVLTWVDAGGYPCSGRCQVRADTQELVLWLDSLSPLPLRPGAAGVLCHRHDARLYHQKSFLVRGTLEAAPDGWCLRPTQFIPRAGIGGLRGTLRFTQVAQRRVRRYLAARGLPQPAIPWPVLVQLKREATKNARSWPGLIYNGCARSGQGAYVGTQ